MSLIYKTFAGGLTQMGPRSIRVRAADQSVDLAREQLVMAGCDLSNFRRLPTVLFSHNPEMPVGTAMNISLGPDALDLCIDFAPVGISHKADEVCGLVKAGIINGVSVGFDPLATEPMDPAKPRGPQRYLRWLLLEVSLCAIPCNPNALVTERSMKSGRVLSGENQAALQEAHDMAEKCRAGIAGVLKGAGLPAAGSPQNPGSPPAPGAGSGQDGGKNGVATMTKAQRIARAIALAPMSEEAASGPALSGPALRAERTAKAHDLADPALDPNTEFTARAHRRADEHTMQMSALQHRDSAAVRMLKADRLRR